MPTTKATAQVTIVDITDAYSVSLSVDAYTFPGSTTAATAGSFQVQASALRGTTSVPCTIVSADVTAPTGITVAVDSTDASIATVTSSTTFTAPGVVTLPISITGTDVVITKSVAVSFAKTGQTGSTPAAPYNYIAGLEAVTIPCDKDGNTLAASSIVIPFSGWQGTSRKACTATVTNLPSGITTGTNTAATTSADGSLTLSVASGSNLGGTSSGTFDIAYKVNNNTTFNTKFSWSKAITGATGGQGIQGVAAVNVICGNEAVTIPCDKDGKVSAATSIVIPFAGYQGTDRKACTVAYSTLPSGMSVASGGNVAATTSADGSLTISVAANATLGDASTGVITLTFTCVSKTFTRKFTWSKAVTGATGAQGNPGVDAITIAIEASSGTVFKNSSGSTTLTAHVYKAGAEVTGTALSNLGTIKWYKDGSSTAAGTGASITVQASQVTNTASYMAKLEG